MRSWSGGTGGVGRVSDLGSTYSLSSRKPASSAALAPGVAAGVPGTGGASATTVAAPGASGATRGIEEGTPANDPPPAADGIDPLGKSR
jgi:hypothetical protein